MREASTSRTNHTKKPSHAISRHSGMHLSLNQNYEQFYTPISPSASPRKMTTRTQFNTAKSQSTAYFYDNSGLNIHEGAYEFGFSIRKDRQSWRGAICLQKDNRTKPQRHKIAAESEGIVEGGIGVERKAKEGGNGGTEINRQQLFGIVRTQSQ